MPQHLLTPEKVRGVVSIPSVATPTILLAMSCFVVVTGATVCYHAEYVSKLFVVVVNSIFIFASFTPLHDASHSSVAKANYRWINDVIGYTCGFLLCFPYSPFRYIHLQHHQYTNDKDKDPDAWTSIGPRFLLPLRWMTVEANHYIHYFKVITKRPLFEVVTGLGQIIFHLYLIWLGICWGYGTTIFYSWVLPGRIAVFFLALCFDYLPHRPHTHTRAENEYLTTSVISLLPSKASTTLLTFPLLHQNYHNIHHLAPYIPFYLYETVWLHFKKDLEKEGTLTIPIIGSRTKLS